MNSILFRPITKDDFNEIKALHELIFPVHYSEDYFNGAIQQKGINNGLLHTVIAEEIHSREIMGFIFYQYLTMSECDEKNMFYREPSEVCYILILGLPEKYRRHGLGSKLISKCIEDTRKRKDCGAIYLHVIDYNITAMRFYEKNNFRCLRKMSEYYLIDTKKSNGLMIPTLFDAYLYIYYCNGYQAPLLHIFLEGIRIGAMWLFNIFSLRSLSTFQNIRNLENIDSYSSSSISEIKNGRDVVYRKEVTFHEHLDMV